MAFVRQLQRGVPRCRQTSPADDHGRPQADRSDERVAFIWPAADDSYRATLARRVAAAHEPMYRVRQLAADGIGIREISRRLAVARNTARRRVRGSDPEMRPPRRHSLEPYQVLLDRLLVAGVLQWRGTLAPVAPGRISRCAAGRHRVGEPPTAR